METAPAVWLTAVSVTLAGLAQTVTRPAMMIRGDQTVRMLVCVSTVERAIRYFIYMFPLIYWCSLDLRSKRSVS